MYEWHFSHLHALIRAMTKERIVAVGLLTQREVTLLGETFDRLWPVEAAPQFEELLEAIDHADQQLQARDRAST